MMKTNDKQRILSATLRTDKVERRSKTNKNKNVFREPKRTEYKAMAVQIVAFFDISAD